MFPRQRAAMDKRFEAAHVGGFYSFVFFVLFFYRPTVQRSHSRCVLLERNEGTQPLQFESSMFATSFIFGASPSGCGGTWEGCQTFGRDAGY